MSNSKKTKLVDQLLKMGASVDQPVLTGSSPLIVSLVYESQLDLVRCLLDAGASVHLENNERETALHKAVLFRQYR